MLARLRKIAPTVTTESILPLLRLRAAEESDPRGEVIRWDEREHASQEALRVAGEPASSSKESFSRNLVNTAIWRVGAVSAAKALLPAMMLIPARADVVTKDLRFMGGE